MSPSESITRQNGQPTAIWSAPVPTASLVRLTLIRSPMFSSIHMRAPPAPQQKDRSELRSISTNSAPGSTCEQLARRRVDLVVPAEVARVVVGDRALRGAGAVGDRGQLALAHQPVEQLGVVHDLELDAELAGTRSSAC